MNVFSLIGFDQFFQLPPCDIDARRCHELLTMLCKYGTCMLGVQEGKCIEFTIKQDIIVKAVRLQKGNHVLSSMKLNSSDMLLAFTIANNANNSVYASLKNDEIQLVLYIH